MHWFGLFPVSWRTGATFVHEVLAFLIVAVVVGHILMALTHPGALRSMIRGWVTVTWARRHAPRWAAEELTAGGADERLPAPTTLRARPVGVLMGPTRTEAGIGPATEVSHAKDDPQR